MGRQSKGGSRKNQNNNSSDNTNSSNIIGNGKVTLTQVAFIVERYLSDNNFSESCATFRSEASSLLPKSSSLRNAPRGLLTLGQMLDDYIHLKEQKLKVEQEKHRLEQETARIQALLQGMQNAMNAYNSGAAAYSVPPPQPQMTPLPAGCLSLKTPPTVLAHVPDNTNTEPAKFWVPTTSNPPRKRKSCKIITDVTQATKKPCDPSPSDQLPGKDSNVVSPFTDLANVQANVQQSSAPRQSSESNYVYDGSLVNKLSAAKSLVFVQSSVSPKSSSSSPRTPPRASSFQSDKSISPLDGATPQQNTPTNCTIISSKTIIVSPCKQSSVLSIERNHCTITSPLKTNSERQSIRDHVRGRLDFDVSDPPTLPDSDGNGHSTSMPNHGDIVDMDLPSLDAFGPNFSLSELLKDFDFEEMDYTFQSTLGASTDAVSSFPCEPKNDGLGTHQEFFEQSSSSTKVVVGKGTDSFAVMRSITKRVQFSSPAKTPRKSPDAEK